MEAYQSLMKNLPTLRMLTSLLRHVDDVNDRSWCSGRHGLLSQECASTELPVCAGLRKARRSEARTICQACQRGTQGQKPFWETTFLYSDEVSQLHTDPRCGAVWGGMVEIRQCKICKDDAA